MLWELGERKRGQGEGLDYAASGMGMGGNGFGIHEKVSYSASMLILEIPSFRASLHVPIYLSPSLPQNTPPPKTPPSPFSSAATSSYKNTNYI